jgi:hypothetical protein
MATQQRFTGKVRAAFQSVAVVAALAVATFGVGCDNDGQSSQGPAVAPKQGEPVVARRPADTWPATQSATQSTAPDGEALAPKSAPPFLMLVEQPMPGSPVEPLQGAFLFPNGTLRLSRTDDGISAVLYSNDPPEAARKNYHGNSFLFNPPPEVRVGELADLTDVHWYYKSASSDGEDTPNGIFLDGLRVHLQPADANIYFEGTPPHLTAHIMGQFRKFSDGDGDGLSTIVVVTGSLPVIVDEGKK